MSVLRISSQDALAADDLPQVERPRRPPTSLEFRDAERVKRILNSRIEFITSESFAAPNAAETILGPMSLDPKETDESPSKRPKPPAGTPPYLAALYETPLLSRDEERDLFRKMNFLKFRAAELREQIASDITYADSGFPQSAMLDQIEACLSHAQRIRNHIIQANLRLVVSIAKKLVDSANDFDQLVSDGNVPLIRAVELFDFERGTRFSTYATWAVRNSLYRATPKNRRHRNSYRTGADLVLDGASESNPAEDGAGLIGRETSKSICKMIEGLDDRDQLIVRARFGLDGTDQPKKFREIAEELGISTERVRQLLARTMKRLRDHSSAASLAPV